MRTTPKKLPLIDSCDGCGVCCEVVTSPPFYRIFDGDGDESWERLKWERPDVLAELLAAEQSRRKDGAPSCGTPCLWYDTQTRRCRHYEFRPRACRVFAVGCDDCREARRRAGIH